MQTPESKNPCFCQVIFVLRKDAPLMPKKAWTGLKFSRKFEIIAMTGWPATARIESCRQEGKQLNTEPKPRLRRKMVNEKKMEQETFRPPTARKGSVTPARNMQTVGKHGLVKSPKGRLKHGAVQT